VDVLQKSNIQIIARPINSREPDFLIEYEHQALNVFDLGKSWVGSTEL
jgi:hypothetical protein